MLATIQDALKRREGYLVGRFGTVELEALVWREARTDSIPDSICSVLERNAGVFPSDTESVEGWCEAMRAAVTAADELAVGWYAPLAQQEAWLLHDWGWNGIRRKLRDLEPYYWPASDRWSRVLEGQRVAVVTSFTESARSQVSRGEATVWPGAGGSLWPRDAQWHWIQTGYAPCLALGRAGWEGSPECWEQAVMRVVDDVVASGARIALIGCGGLGMIIGAHLKARGIVAIVMGGAIQVFFGIKGERWATHEVIRGFWNDAWAWPSAEETPGGAEAVEGACYWSMGAAASVT